MFHVASICTPFAFCCVLLRVVAQSLKPVKLLNKQFQTFLLFCDRRSVAQQCWIRLHSSSNIHARTLHMVYKSLMGCILPTMHCSPTLLAMHTTANVVGSTLLGVGHAAEDQKQIRTSSWWINHPQEPFSEISPHEVLQSWLLIQSIIYLWRIKRGRGGGLKRERELINFLPLKSEGELIREGGLIEDLRYSDLMFFSLRFVGTRRHVWLFFFFKYGVKTILKLLFFVATTKSYLLHHPISIRGSHMKTIGQWK